MYLAPHTNSGFLSVCASFFVLVSQVQDERCVHEEAGGQEAWPRAEFFEGRQGRECGLGPIEFDSMERVYGAGFLGNK